MQAKIKNRSTIELPEGNAVNLFFEYIGGHQVNIIVSKKKEVFTVFFEWSDIGPIGDLVEYINDNL